MNTIYPIEIKKSDSPKNPTRNLRVPEKYHMNIGTGVIIDTCDRMRPLKIRNELVLKDWTETVIVPETCRQAVEPYVPEELKLKTHYLRNKCKDIWEWSEQVYEYVRDTVGK